MGIVQTTLPYTSPDGRLRPAARAMQVGQHVIALILTSVGAIRAVGDGVAIPLAIACGIGFLAWHTAGALLPTREGEHRALVLGWFSVLALLWVGLVAVSPEFTWLAFLLWLLAGHLLPAGWALTFATVVFGIVVTAPLLHHGSTSYANVFGPLIGGIFALGISRGYLELLRDAAERERLVAALTRAQQETAELQDELARAQRHSGAIAERSRLARDIHDTVAQSLSSIRLLAHAERESAAGAARSDAQALTRVETLATESLGDVRRIIAALSPAELDEDALGDALGRLLTSLRESTGVQTEIHVDDTLPQLPMAAEIALLRTAQSALANVRLHAAATRVAVHLIDGGDAVRLDVIDDGLGFDTVAWERVGRLRPGAGSYGLRFMRARLRELGGGLEIESAPGEGTALSAFLPIGPMPHEADHTQTGNTPSATTPTRSESA